MNRILSYKLLGVERVVNLDGTKDLEIIDSFIESGATDIKIWTPECSCEAGWDEDDGYVYACAFCRTGIQRREACIKTMKNQAEDSTNNNLKKTKNLENKLDKRLVEIASLQPGWLSGEGASVHPKLIEFAKQYIINLVVDHNLSIPFIYPTPNGGIQIEWSYSPWDVSVEFENESDQVTLVAVNTESQAIESVSLSSCLDQMHSVAQWIGLKSLIDI